MGNELYSRLRETFQQNLKWQRESKLNLYSFFHLFFRSLNDEQFLQFINQFWQNYCNQMKMIRSIFLYLDQTFILQTSGLSSIWDLGLILFKEEVMKHPDIQQKTRACLLNEIRKERNKEPVNRDLMKSLFRMYTDLQLYAQEIEIPLIEHSEQFYKQRAKLLMETLDVANYLIYTEQAIKEEQERVLQYLNPTTRLPLLHVLEKELLAAYAQLLLDAGFTLLMNQDRLPDLNRWYLLYSRIQAQDLLKNAFSQYIKQSGLLIVQDEQKDDFMIQNLLAFKKRMDICLQDGFFSRHSESLDATAQLWLSKFQHSLNEAFEWFINRRANKPAHLLASHIDKLLKSGVKQMTERELEHQLDMVLVLFRYLNGKDIFEAFYKKDLAKRLLYGKSASMDLERSMLSRLKIECGSGFTSKLEGMFKDIDLSKEIMTSFKYSRYAKEIHVGFDMNVNILTQGFWPTYPTLSVILPQNMLQYQEAFQKFYLNKFHGRRLLWQNNLGQCLVKASFPLGNKELQISLSQCLVLLCFNQAEQLTLTQLKLMTGLDQAELKLTLASLSDKKQKVLLKLKNDLYQVNDQFQYKLTRIKFNQAQVKETKEEQSHTQEQIFLDRQSQIDAAIVRIMKTRKILTHAKLMQEICEVCAFPLTSSDLKKRVESLIEREFLMREVNDPGKYHYLA